MEQLIVNSNANKNDLYAQLIPQIKSLVAGEKNMIANMANVASALHTTFGFFWVGFYICDSDSELVLAPFQGPLACTRIQKGRGVCGSAWAEARTIIVDDVEKFAGHIACSSNSKSEIVVPLFSKNKVFAVLDIDSDRLNSFDEIDKKNLEKIAQFLSF